MTARTPMPQVSALSQLRANELETPELSARNLNDVIRGLTARLSALERSFFVDLSFTTDSNGAIPASLSVDAPAWEAKGVFLARAWDETRSESALYVRIGWQRDGTALTVTPFIDDLFPSTSYVITVEVRG